MGCPGATRRHGPDIALKALHAARSPTNSPAPPLPAPRQRLDCPASQSESADDYYCGQLLPRLLKRNTVQALKSKKKKKKKKGRMLSNLANYLLGGNISSAQDARERSNNESPESLPVMARLSQVEVEGDDWILIDPAVEGATALEESWYVTPPACFTWAGPVNVETSPLEDLLIEHPSMSVYRATASPVAPDTPPPTPDEPEARDAEEDALIPAASAKTKGRRVQEDVRTPVAIAKTKGRRVQEGARTPAASAKTKERDVKEHISNRAVTAALERSPGRTENDQQSRRPAIHDGRPAVGRVRTEKRIIQLRSAQKVLEKRSTQLLKRSHLERSNKLSEVFSVRGKRPRRQDRLRIQNSGVNNNRKCC